MSRNTIRDSLISVYVIPEIPCEKLFRKSRHYIQHFMKKRNMFTVNKRSIYETA